MTQSGNGMNSINLNLAIILSQFVFFMHSVSNPRRQFNLTGSKNKTDTSDKDICNNRI